MKVSNVAPGVAPAAITATGAPFDQVYRNTDGKWFRPTLLRIVNSHASDDQVVTLYDQDLTDAGESTDTDAKMVFVVLASTMVTLGEGGDAPLRRQFFRYGIAASALTANGVTIEVEGEES